MKNKKLLIIAIVLILLTGYLVFLKSENKPGLIDTNNNNSEQTIKKDEQFDKTKYSIDDPNSIWVVVNKKRPLSEIFVPSDLIEAPVAQLGTTGTDNMKIRNTISSDLLTMVNAAKARGLNLGLVSGYRSLETQKSVYNNEVGIGGVDKADTISARAGYSEHQTGLVADLGRADGYCALVECFGETPEGKWLAENAYKYGFIIRYQKGKEAIVGYEYEPWHFRYVGKDLAEQLQKTGQTMEEFFGLPPAATY